MALDLEEQEQLEELRAWWKQHAKWVLTGVTVFLVVVAGWRGWQTWTHKQSSESSVLFERALQAATTNDTKTAKEVTGLLMEDYSGSAYAAPAAWLAGRVNYESDNLKSAVAQYRYALDHAKNDGLIQMARLRLAAVLLDNKDQAGAMQLLDQPHDPAYAGLYANLKGDVLADQGKTAEAREAYALAVQKLGDKSALRPLVEIKLDGLGG